jgi:hypothetical protein
LSVGYWQLAIGSCQLAIGSWPLAVVSWPLSVVSCQLSVGYWQLSVVSCQLSIVSNNNFLNNSLPYYNCNYICSLFKTDHMNLDKYIAVSGLPGLYELVNSRSNGLLVSDIDQKKTRFVSMRKHQFTPLATVAIYTYDDATELKIIFKTMLEKMEDAPPVSIKEDSDTIRAYFESILPDYDEDRVQVSDIKKVIKWFNFLNDRGLLTLSSDEEE